MKFLSPYNYVHEIQEDLLFLLYERFLSPYNYVHEIQGYLLFLLYERFLSSYNYVHEIQGDLLYLTCQSLLTLSRWVIDYCMLTLTRRVFAHTINFYLLLQVTKKYFFKINPFRTVIYYDNVYTVNFS